MLHPAPAFGAAITRLGMIRMMGIKAALVNGGWISDWWYTGGYVFWLHIVLYTCYSKKWVHDPKIIIFLAWSQDFYSSWAPRILPKGSWYIHNMHTYRYTIIWLCIIHIYIYTYTYIYIYTYVYIYYVYICIYIYIMYTYVYIYIYIHIYIHIYIL